MLSEASILFMRVEPSTLEGSAGHLCAFPSVNLLNCGNHDYMKHDTGWILCGSVHIYSFPHLLLSTEHQVINCSSFSVCSDAWGLPLASQCPCQCLGTSRSFSGNSVDTLEFSIAGAHCQMPRNFKGRNLGCLVCLISCPCGVTEYLQYQSENLSLTHHLDGEPNMKPQVTCILQALWSK